MAHIPAASKQFRLTGWHVLAIFGTMFGVMLAVNVLFITLALKTFSGETNQAYINGLKFNETLAANARQAEMGWRMSLGLNRPTGGGAMLEARLMDRDGQPLTGANMTGFIGRTTSHSHDQALVFSETGPGVYRAVIAQLPPGRWKFAAGAQIAGAPKFETETTLSLR